MFHKIKSVTPLPEFRLLIHFCDGSARKYDTKPLFQEIKAFQAFQVQPGLFEQVRVDTGGYGISWNDHLDLDGEELWVNGIKTETPFDDLLSFADAASIWTLNESTLRKAIASRKLVEGVDAQKYGKQWVVTRSAMLREYGEPNP